MGGGDAIKGDEEGASGSEEREEHGEDVECVEESGNEEEPTRKRLRKK